MSRASLKKIWQESIVYVVLERFVLAICALAFYNLVISNSMHLDGNYRVALGIVVIGIAWGVGHAVYLGTHRPVTPPTSQELAAPQPTASHISGPASASGDKSIANTGDGNTFKTGEPPATKKPNDKQK
jgi:hypothetical protein